MKAALYVRVSTQEQKLTGLSVDNQIDALKAYCNDNGYEVYKIYNDAGISAHASYKRRPALLELIKDCQDGKVSEILITRIDRWFRSVKDYYLVQEQLNGVPWRAIWEDYTTATSEGQFKVNIMLSISEAEAARTSEKVKSIMRYKKEKGEYNGHSPTGYIRKDKGLLKDEATKEGVQAFFDTFAITCSGIKARQAAQEKGLTIRVDTARDMLLHPSYAGGDYYSCEPYITKEQYQKNIIEVKRRSKAKTPSGRVYIFSGLMKCAECGGAVGGYFVNRKAISYRCNRHSAEPPSCRGFSIKQEKIEDALLNVLRSDLNGVTIPKLEIASKKASAKVSSLKSKLNRIKTLYIEGDITEEEYRARRDATKAEIEKIETSTKKPLSLPSNWEDIYNELDDEHKRAFWRGIVDRILIDRDDREHPKIFYK